MEPTDWMALSNLIEAGTMEVFPTGTIAMMRKK
jgi:hypothetical protein